MKNLRIPTLHILVPQPVRVTNCWIGKLIAHPNTRVSIDLEDTWVGHLKIDGANCVANTKITGGGILTFACTADGEQPVCGPFELSRRTFLAGRYLTGILYSPQNHRNLFSRLSDLGNHTAAGIIRRTEEQLERESDSRTNKVFSYLYEFSSAFGTSTLRPLGCLLSLFIVNFVIVFITNGAQIAQDEAFYQRGWRHLLIQCDLTGRIAKAVVLALDSITNPLGVFANRTLLVADHWLLAVWLAASGLFSASLIALFIFALRRRFKVQ